jgi:hypothetical protein
MISKEPQAIKFPRAGNLSKRWKKYSSGSLTKLAERRHPFGLTLRFMFVALHGQRSDSGIPFGRHVE